MNVLVDTSVWIAYFRGTGNVSAVDALIDQNRLMTNDLLLAEMIPFLRMRRQSHLIRLMQTIQRCPLVIEWDAIVEMQVLCLRNGINKVGIPDLIIAQNAIQNDLPLFTLDRHFNLMSKYLPLILY